MAGGKRAGARPKKRLRPDLLALALAMTAALVAWGYLVVAAISFGSDARQGESSSWWYLALAALGAMACLFLALLLAARITRSLGITRPPERGTQPAPPATDPPTSPHPYDTPPGTTETLRGRRTRD